MRIALVAPLVSAIHPRQLGGSQAFLADLAAGLTGRGHEVDVWAASGSWIPGAKVEDTGFDPAAFAGSVYRAGSPPAATDPALDLAFREVYRRVSERDYDVVHNHSFDAPAIRGAIGLRSAVAHTLHLPPTASLRQALAEARSGSDPPTVITVSRHMLEVWGESTIDELIYPGIPTASIPWSAAAGYGAVFAGRLSPEKGAAEAIEIALAAGLHIAVFGDPYDQEYAQARIYPRRGDEGVSIFPAVERTELWGHMSRARVVLCPALWSEAFGLVAAEAQATGTPVVGFRSGALPEVVAEGTGGYLVDLGDVRTAVAAVGEVGQIDRRDCRAHAELTLDLGPSLDAHEKLYMQMRRSSGVTGRA